MKTHEYEILLITETNINTSCIENWDGYTVFSVQALIPGFETRNAKNERMLPLGERNTETQRPAIDLPQILSTQG